MFSVRFYRTISEECPVETYLDSLPGKQAQKVVWVLRLVEQLDPVPTQYLKKLVDSEGLWEVRAQQGGDAFRLLGFSDGQELVLVSGFTKKTEKTPKREIEVAEARRKDYLRRKTHE